jgi:formylglycine-generating enzyme required for sulfatase activity
MDVCVSEGVELMKRFWTATALAVVAAATTFAAQAPPLTSQAADFIEIPGGPFSMGVDRAQDPQAFDNERWSPAQGTGTVDEAAFFISRHEVTVAEFTRFAQATKWPVDPRALAQPAEHPVAFVSWPDALAYCRWLEQQLKAHPSPPLAQAIASGWRVTLPTEAQWEKAARDGDGRRFPWGNDPRRDRANFGSQGPVPVGKTACPECAYGLLDMAGNPMQPYPYDPSDDRATLEQDALWVMRGGGYADGLQLLRATTRGGAEPGARRPFIGFRVVVAPK